jgi:hypothetical protein
MINQLFQVELDPFSQLSGLLAFITILVAWLYGALILIKAIQLKYRTFYYLFLAVIFTMSPWFSSGIGYIYWVITAEALPYDVYILLGTLGVPIALFAWFQIYLPGLRPKAKKPLLITTAILSIVYYVYVLFFLYLAPGAPVMELIAIRPTAVDNEYKAFALIFLAYSLLISTVTGNDFSINSMKSEDKLLKWKGRFLILSFNLFAVGAIGDGFLPLTPVTLIIFRIFMVLSSTFYYIGFILPKWMRKILPISQS